MQNPHPPPPLCLAPTGKIVRRNWSKATTKDWMTSPKADRLLLMFCASFIPWPVTPDLLVFLSARHRFLSQRSTFKQPWKPWNNVEKSWGLRSSWKNAIKNGWFSWFFHPSLQTKSTELGSFLHFSSILSHPKKRRKKTPNYDDSDHLRASLIQQDQSSESFQCRYHFPSGYLRVFFLEKIPKKLLGFS